MKPSASQHRGPCICPVCAAISPESDEVEGVAAIGHEADDGAPGRFSRFVEAFVCPAGHTLADLNPEQEGKVLEQAWDWISDGLAALEDAHWDSAYDLMGDR